MMMMLSKVKRGRRGNDDDALPVAMVLLLPSLRRSLSPLPPWPFLDICPLFSSIFLTAVLFRLSSGISRLSPVWRLVLLLCCSSFFLPDRLFSLLFRHSTHFTFHQTPKKSKAKKMMRLRVTVFSLWWGSAHVCRAPPPSRRRLYSREGTTSRLSLSMPVVVVSAEEHPPATLWWWWRGQTSCIVFLCGPPSTQADVRFFFSFFFSFFFFFFALSLSPTMLWCFSSSPLAVTLFLFSSLPAHILECR